MNRPLASNFPRIARLASMASFLVLSLPIWALAQAEQLEPVQTETAAAASTSLNYSFIDLIQFGGWVGYVIILLSVAAVSLIVQYTLSIRAARVVPDADRERLTAAVKAGEFCEIVKSGKEDGASYLTKIVAAGIREEDRGYDAIVKGMEDAADVGAGALLRRIEHLNIIANIAPMLGLLGTVIGMVNSFNQISIAVGGVDPRRLAGGIFEALMTTVMGLIVAIPSLYMFGVFRNRVDALAARAADEAETIIEPLKRRPVKTGNNA
jgi:biopolymer transport protein ExbB